MNLKKVFLVLFAIAILFPLSAQQGKDVVLVVDTSSSMFAYYNDVGAYLSGQFLADNIANGDTLHIISFGSKPRFEIARRILGDGDIETASARIWLLYPLDPSSDPGAAINYAEQYVRSVQGGRPKKVFIISDSDLSGQVSAAAGRFQPDADLQFIQAGSRMGQGQPGAGRGPAIVAAGTGVSGAGAAAAAGAASAGSIAGTAGTGAAVTGADPAAAGGQDAQGASADGAASAGGAGAGAGAAGAVAAGAGAADPSSGSGAQGGAGAAGTGGAGATGAGSGGMGLQNIPLWLILLGALLLLLLVIFIIFRMRNLQSSPKKAMAQLTSDGGAANAELLNSYASKQAEASLQGSSRPYPYRRDTSYTLSKPPMLNIFVEEQNTAIGRRNIHALKRGATYTVGGGNSDFLIFLVEFPARLGRLSFDGTNCTFTPLRGEYFPDIGSSQVPECIGKPIRIISKKNYEVFFHFEPYKDPLIEMNELLNSIKVPEPPKMELPKIE